MAMAWRRRGASHYLNQCWLDSLMHICGIRGRRVKPCLWKKHRGSISWRCSNYIFIPDLTPGFNGMCKDNCQMRRETFKFWDLVWLILEVWQYFLWQCLQLASLVPWWILSRPSDSLHVLKGLTIKISVSIRFNTVMYGLSTDSHT